MLYIDSMQLICDWKAHRQLPIFWLYFRCITCENNPVNKSIYDIWFALVQFKTADQMRPDTVAGNPGIGTAAYLDRFTQAYINSSKREIPIPSIHIQCIGHQLLEDPISDVEEAALSSTYVEDPCCSHHSKSC